MTYRIRPILAAATLALLLPLASQHAGAQTMKAADVHPAGYPTVAAIENMIRHYDYTDLYYSTYFWVESAWWRLQEAGL